MTPPQTHADERFSFTAFLQFFIPSLLGLALFVIPVSHRGTIMVPIAFLAGLFQEAMQTWIPHAAFMAISLSSLGSIVAHLLLFWNRIRHRKVAGHEMEHQKITLPPLLRALFMTSTLDFVTRLCGFFFVTCVYFQWGPEVVCSSGTGRLIFSELLPVLFSVFFFAGFFLPLLSDFGLLDFFGTLATKIMRPIFKLPGRSAIDCLASWVGDGAIGILLSSKQYELGYYNKKEVSIIGCNFSLVSVTFCVVIITYAKLESLMLPFFVCFSLCVLACAFITPRIPPLSRKPETYYHSGPKELYEEIPEGKTLIGHGYALAVERAQQNFVPRKFVQDGFRNVLDMWIGVIPLVMAYGTFSLILAEYTPVFSWLGLPFQPLLELCQVDYAVEASQAILLGFADMFLPVVVTQNIPSVETRFIIATLSVSQLIFMSETGGLLLGSKIPVNFKDLVLIFLARTFISLPIIIIFAKVFC